MSAPIRSVPAGGCEVLGRSTAAVRSAAPSLHRSIADHSDALRRPDGGMTAVYTLRETRALSDRLVLGYLTVDFGFIDRATLTVYLSVIIRHDANGWRIVHYQVSRLD